MKQIRRCGAIYPWTMDAMHPHIYEHLVCNVPLDRHERDTSGRLINHRAIDRQLKPIHWGYVNGQQYKRGGPNYLEKGEHYEAQG